jgi:hypothetical protein
MKINICFRFSFFKSKFPFCKNLLETYLKPKPHIKSKHQKLLVFWKTYLKPTFTIWNIKINARWYKHILFFIIFIFFSLFFFKLWSHILHVCHGMLWQICMLWKKKILLYTSPIFPIKIFWHHLSMMYMFMYSLWCIHIF